MAAQLLPGLERKLKADITGEVMFDRFSRGRYATDASHYQMMPVGVVAPRSIAEAERTLALAREEGISVLPRGGGTSQAGQAVNESLVIDCSKYLTQIYEIDVGERRCTVEPGIVLDDLNRTLKPYGLWFPVDVSTASRATIGGMTANNSCGGRSLRYGTMRDNVRSIDALLADGTKAHFGPVSAGLSNLPPGSPLRPLARTLLDIGLREADEIAAHFPKVQRRVGGYNLDAFAPNAPQHNLAHILLGSEGTLAFSTRIELKLSPVMGKRVIGACHFGSFYEAMNAAQHLVKLKPIAVELIDRTMLELAGEIAMFRPTLKAFVRGEPEAILLVEFDEGEFENARRLKELSAMMGDLGFSFDKDGARWGGVVEVSDPALQAAIADVRASGLNIMMSMKEEGKPISFVEDCAVPLMCLADYTQRLTQVFEKHGTRGTWYAHASVGCLHVRPVLNLRQEKDVKAMRAIAEEAFAMVRDYKGSHSGEHGDGIVRSEFHEFMFGKRLVTAFEEVKDKFDPKGLLNPGKIVRAPKFDDREKFRYAPGYAGQEMKTQLDWSAWPGAGGGFQGAVEMCNNNGACRKAEGGVMCPSWRVTRQERDVTRGRANSLRLAITGQLGPDALTSDEMAETMKLCVSCKACRRECPTGVDMARMKIEVQAARAARFGLSLRDRLIGWMPRYAPYAAKMPGLFNARDKYPRLKRWSERFAGLSTRRTLPQWRKDVFDDASSDAATSATENGREVVLLADTFNRYFERENLDAAITVLHAAGYTVHVAKPADGSKRPLCCGRTFLSIGRVDQAKREAERVIASVAPFVARGVPVIGLEPSCILGFRDEIPAMIKSEGAEQLSLHALMFEEFLVREAAAGRLDLPLKPVAKRALIHGHCHQKAFGMFGAVQRILKLIPDLDVETVESSCCGMAGAFGYGADTIDVSMAMGELSLLPAVRKADADTLIVADGTSCRHQIHDGALREALHVARVLAMSVQVANATAFEGEGG
jgi:FAD/FMN-containing dehydrogenase/Fe-S oxidoreductase